MSNLESTIFTLAADQLAAIRARCEAATPGPWAYEAHGDTGMYGVGVIFDDDENPISGENIDDGFVVSDPVAVEIYSAPDAEFIAHARTDIPALFAHITEQQGEIARLRQALSAHGEEA